MRKYARIQSIYIPAPVRLQRITKLTHRSIFAVTNFWEHLARGQTGAGKKEATQAWNLALAASRTPSLQHYLWSTLPHASAITKGAHKCAHFDYKAEIDSRIAAELPDLTRITTFVWVAWYPTNMAYMPPIRMTKVEGKEAYEWIQASPAESLLPASGNVSQNTGRFVLGALQHPDATRGGRYVDVKTDTPSFEEIVRTWADVTGKKASYKEVSRSRFEEMYGVAGSEMEDQYAFGTACGDWEKGSGKTFVSQKELGIKDGELVDFRRDLEGVREALL